MLPVKRKHNVENPLARLHEEMDNLFCDFFGNMDMPFLRKWRWPVLDVAENQTEFIVKAEVPGCEAEDISISVNHGRLTISGEKKQEEEKQKKDYYYLERSYGSFRRDLDLGCEIDQEKIEASCKNGVLNIRLPKAEQTKAVKIKVKNQ